MAADEPEQESEPERPLTLAIDIGGTGLKASVLDAAGDKVVDRVRLMTPYPCPPRVLIRRLDTLTHELPAWDRVFVGFPGFVRHGRVLTAPNLSTKKGPGTPLSGKLVEAWAGFPLRAELEARLGKPVRLANDADMQGLAVIAGDGLELVLTLGTGLGTAVFQDGVPMPHLELTLMPFHGKGTFQDTSATDASGIGNKKLEQAGARGRRDVRQRAAAPRPRVRRRRQREETQGRPRPPRNDRGQHRGILGGIRLWDIAEI